LPKLFINALRRAQIMQANYLLLDENSDIEHLRQRGLLSNTVSESKQFFRTQKPIAKTLCERAMKELARWLVFNRRTARG
ncbi:hypothetical protein LJC19_08160, partial [Oxalobacter sp. OttesenSCG-928-P03]|nr:hypothetical protein [Oxalobacter sp. OttesenSCG-928-P03]